MISGETARLLEHIAGFEHGMPQNGLPNGVNWRVPEELERRGLISFSTLVPPNTEPECPQGMWAARLTTAGRDALAEYQRADHEMRKQDAQRYADKEERRFERAQDRRHDWALAIFSVLAGSALTLFVEHILLLLL